MATPTSDLPKGIRLLFINDADEDVSMVQYTDSVGHRTILGLIAKDDWGYYLYWGPKDQYWDGEECSQLDAIRALMNQADPS